MTSYRQLGAACRGRGNRALFRSPIRLFALAAATATSILSQVHAANQYIDDTTIAQVAVNGGSDTANAGVSCVRISSPTVAACPSGWVAIQNGNKPLLAASLQAKASGSRVGFYYEDASASQHCPGITHTPCTVISVSVK